MLYDFYPEAWELSPNDMEFMFNDFYFDKSVDSLNPMAVQASTEKLNVVSIRLNDGSAMEPKADLDDNPHWTTHFTVVQAEESWMHPKNAYQGENAQVESHLNVSCKGVV